MLIDKIRPMLSKQNKQLGMNDLYYKERKQYLKNKFSLYSCYLIGYLVYLLFMIRKSVVDADNKILLLALLPFFIVPMIKIMHLKSYRICFAKTSFYLLIFFYLYYFSTYHNIGKNLQGYLSFTIIGMHIFGIYMILNDNRINNIETIRNTFLFLSIFIVFIPHYLITKSLSFGSFYNLIDPSLLTTTTVEAPFIVAILFILATFDAVFNKKWSIINVFSIIFSILVLLIFSRRGFIFSSLIALFFYQLCNITKKNFVIYLSILLLFLPMFWDLISLYIVEFFNLDFVQLFVQRTDTSEITDATGRAITWTNVLDLFFSFKAKYFFGISGGPPDNLFLQDVNEPGRYSHAHNTFLQLFLEGGYFINILFLLLVIHAFTNYNKARNLDKNSQNFYFIILIFFFSLSATETLVRMQQFTTFVFCFVLVGFNLTNLKIKQRIYNLKTSKK